ncbi:MAG: UDP-glucose--hexose-1-phosphate uridylyltransferase [Clostridia bacterium]|nr:UDP-glucose--hexose-1-phosphate uridylyltransferase [Clostridia bacterium]
MIYSALNKLIDYSERKGITAREDIYVIRNTLMRALKLSDWVEREGVWNGEDIDTLLAPIIEYAVENNIISDTTNSRDLFDTEIMGIFTPMPREVKRIFDEKYSVSPKEATDWYFEFSKNLNYVRAGRIAKDLKWEYNCEYGVLDITINRSKPEKDPRDIAAAAKASAAAYPKCQLCAENAGFAGHASHPARQNLRPIGITVDNGEWQLQYSPYGYYNEHCIAFNSKHIPMVIDARVFEKMLDIIEYLPHYFIGSNADLPIVGGSILSHEHFQGGGYRFAMDRAETEHCFEINGFENVNAGIIKWPMSVIRLSSENRASLSAACAHILEKWRNYSDKEAYIFAETDGVPHNTITPIARRNGGLFEIDLVLRNNITTSERPLGLYHPNPKLHHIKKENIGLIEVMGLAVLPARLANEIDELESAILAKQSLYGTSLEPHAEWVCEITAKYDDINPNNIRKILEDEIGRVFLNVLEDAGVFKRNEDGKAAFMRFIDSL